MGSKKISGIEQLVDDATAELRRRSDRISALEATERELREAVKVLAEYGGAFHGTGGPFKCWDSRRAIDAFDAVLANPIAAAAVREAGR